MDLPGILNVCCLFSLWLHATGEGYADYDFTTLRPLPTFVETTPTNFTFNQGELARLICTVNNLGTKKVIWRRASEFNPLTIGTKTFVGNYRIHVEHTPLGNDWNLLIKKVQIDDAGKYECQISAKQRNLRRFVTLTVLGEYKPSWADPVIPHQPDKKELKSSNNTNFEDTNKLFYDIRITGPSYVEKGSRIVLVCNATGDEHPPDDLDWFKDGDKVTTDHSKGISIRKQMSIEYKTIASVLRIEKARLKNTGVYICRTSDLQITRKIVDILNSDTYNVKRGTLKDKDKQSNAISHGIFSGKSYKTHKNSAAINYCVTSQVFFVVFLQTMCKVLQCLQT